MPLDSPPLAITNNLRLPDALIVRHGPGPLLARFVLAADKAARRKGITLRVRHDFEELVDVNQFYVGRQLWYPLLDAFNPRHAELNADNAFWISGENEHGEIVMTNACRVLDWTGSTLAEQARALWYGRDEGQRCEITADAAWEIGGMVAWGGAAWIRPDQRGKQLSYISGRTHKAYACARWPIDWSFCYIGVANATRGLADTWGHKHLSHSILYPDSAHGEQVVAYSSSSDFYSDIAAFMARGGILEPEDFDSESLPSGLEHIVTNTSPEGVFHGSINRA
jgi:hypothetical protein